MAANPYHVTAAMEAVQVAAAFVVEDDETWAKFEKYMAEEVKVPIPPGSRQILDGAIEVSDVVRQSICKHHGIPIGDPYPRKFS